MTDARRTAVTPHYDEQERYRQVRNITVLGAVVNIVLVIAQLLAGLVGHSQALVADAVHTFSDLVGDIIVLIAAKHTARAADEDHPYGHGRIETLATVGVGALLILVALGIAWDAGSRLFNPTRLLAPGISALVIACVVVFAKEVLYRYTVRVARRVRSDMVLANAWHHRSDALSSVVVVIGILGTMAGLGYLDAIAAVAVSAMIAKAGWEIGWRSLRELVDTGLAPERVESIRATILAVDGVQALHLLRTRSMGGKALVDVHLLVDPKLSVSEGHQISEAVRTKLIHDIDEVGDVTVHIDPEDDEVAGPSGRLPLRREVLGRLNRLWRGRTGVDRVRNVTLHYLNGKIHVELLLPLAAFESLDEARAVARELSSAAAAEPDIAEIRVAFG